MRTILFYGNCQTRALMETLAQTPVAEHFRLKFLRSYDEETRIDEPVTDADYATCAVLCEQVDWNEFPWRARLPDGCATLRIPSLDFNALWPFEAINPYNPRPGGRFIRGDRIVIRGLEQGMTAEELLSFYLTGWGQYGIDPKRVLELERYRWKKRDERCDIKMGDEIFARFVRERLFWSTNHPLNGLLLILARKVAAWLARIDPQLAGIAVDAVPDEVGERMSDAAAPIHPEIARAFGLTWYDPNERYRQTDDVAYTFEEYYDELIRYSIAVKNRQDGGEAVTRIGAPAWAPPVRGAQVEPGATTGCYPDGFMGSRLRFTLVAEDALSTLTIAGFCPEFHLAPIELKCIAGDAHTVRAISPAEAFEIHLPMQLAPGERVRVEIAASSVFNMLERGESEDNRDLSVLLLSIEGA